MRILVVEDEKKIASLLRRGLREQGFTVDVLENGIEAYEQASTQPYDTMILDIMLPGRDGLSVLRQLRENGILTPVLLLTARGEVNERIEGLNLGADDYLSKPFSMDEVTARVRALLRRATGEKLSLYKLGDLTMNLVSREIYRGKRKVDLTTREFGLLEYLIGTPGQVFTRTQIQERVWDYHFDPNTNLVDVYIQRLRRKVDDGEAVKLIHTVRGVGYCMKAEP
ncbi:MAG TPA: response regulator transcription factor [Chthoniobacteraceae bacterium]|jgi:DNA-binding response OmpR family regulator|nr:response regulator transcription factor [Chthoniobacteraceae bacterium]